MAASIHFVQQCPVCGRRLEVRVRYLGKKVSCPHCHGSFTATDDSYRRPQDELMRRAEQLIESAESYLPDREY